MISMVELPQIYLAQQIGKSRRNFAITNVLSRRVSSFGHRTQEANIQIYGFPTPI
jgi:hypothetical protein